MDPSFVVTAGLGVAVAGQAQAVGLPVPRSNTFYQLSADRISPSRCLDVIDRSLSPGAEVQIYSCRSSTDSQRTAQLFQFAQPSSPPGSPPIVLPGGFQVINKASGLCLTAFDPTAGDAITQESCANRHRPMPRSVSTSVARRTTCSRNCSGVSG